MTAWKRLVLAAAVVGGFAVSAAPQADAGIIFRRVAPVRRVAARAVLPPYPVARAVTPVYRPYYRPYGGFYGRPYGYGPGFYGPGVSIGFGVY